MSKRKAVDPATLDSITGNLFTALPLLRKQLGHIEAMQGEHGMPLSHIQVLTMLNDTGILSVSEISKQLAIAKPNITPLIDRLIEEGLVERIRDTQDRRVVNISILDAGRKRLSAIRGNISKQALAWGETISSADLKELSEALQSLSRILPILRKQQ